MLFQRTIKNRTARAAEEGPAIIVTEIIDFMKRKTKEKTEQ